MLQTYVNIAKNSLKRKNLFVMAKKVLSRVKERDQKALRKNILTWCQQHAEPFEPYLNTLDADLWQESQTVCAEIKKMAEEKLNTIDMDLGGGGNYPMLYFFTRYTKAQTIVETGVAAGWSSQAILKAIKKNANGGHLYSSDFPYFRLNNPEELSGYIVDDELKDNWSLFIDGDENNLPQICNAIETVDLFHYDSDKSYQGRSFAHNLILPKCHNKSIIIFDDIQDNTHFQDYVEANQCSYHVFAFEGKYVGLIKANKTQEQKKL